MKVVAGWVLLAALAFGEGAVAGPAMTLADQYKEYIEVGVLDGQHKAWNVPKTSLRLSSTPDGAGYRVPSSVAFTFPLPWTTKSAAVPIMETVAADLQRICSSNGGELKFTPQPARGEPTVEREIKQLLEKGLFGRFECASETYPFEIEVQPGNLVSRSFSVTLTWTLVLATAPPELILKVRESRRSDVEEVKAFRRSIKPGVPVAVLASEVPTQHISESGQRLEKMLRGKRYYVCGMAVEANEALVQIQVNGGLFFVAPTHLRPVKERVDGKHSLPLDELESWCLSG